MDFDQIPARVGSFLSVNNTSWIYPLRDLQAALAATSIPYTFDGTILKTNSLADLVTLYGQVFDQTAISQPVGNTGFSLGAGTQLDDLGKEIVWQIPGGVNVIRWRLMRQLTPQLPATVIPAPGNSPVGTIGYGTVWVAYSNYPSLDEEMFVRVG